LIIFQKMMSAMPSKMRTSILNNYCFIPEIDGKKLAFDWLRQGQEWTEAKDKTHTIKDITYTILNFLKPYVLMYMINNTYEKMS
jgi:hypothetical protein